MIDDPILIVMMGRSGSSMTAGIFNLHGVWVGSTPPPSRINQKGFFENRKVKLELRRWFNKSFLDVPEGKPGWREKVEGIIREQGYRGGPWLYKHGATFWKAWYEFNPRWVLVWRDPEMIFQSIRNAQVMQKFTDPQVKESIRLHHEQMRIIKSKFDDVFDVEADRLIQGDDSQIAAAIEGCGLTYDPMITREFVEPKLWHYAQD